MAGPPLGTNDELHIGRFDQQQKKMALGPDSERFAGRETGLLDIKRLRSPSLQSYIWGEDLSGCVVQLAMHELKGSSRSARHRPTTRC